MKNVKADVIKDEITSFFDGIEVTEHNESLKIYTDLFSTTFYGIKYMGTFNDVKYVLELIPTGNNQYKINVKKGDKDFIKGTYSRKNTRDANLVTITYDVDFVVNVDDVAYNVAIDLETKDSLNPSVAKLNVKDSIEQQFLRQDEVDKINKAMDDYGTFGVKRAKVVEDVKANLDKLPLDHIGTKIFDYLTKYVTVGDLAVMQNENTETPDNNQVEQQTTN